MARLEKVPDHIVKTPRMAGEAISAIGVKGKWPIGDLFHARLAAIYIKSPSHATKREQVLRSLERYYPDYNWRAYVGAGAGQMAANPMRRNGVYDPSKLKAIYLAGGPGSGKSFTASSLFDIPRGHVVVTSAQGLKVVNSDPAFEFFLRKEGIDPKSLATMSPQQFAAVTEGEDSPRGRAKAVKKKQAARWEAERLGLVIDGTGDEYEKVAKEKARLEALGYDTYMVFVNTSLPVAMARNRARARSLPDDIVVTIWNAVQQNLGKYQQLFGAENMVIVDNTVYGPVPDHIQRAVARFLRAPVRSRIGRAWVEAELAKRKRFNPSGLTTALVGAGGFVAGTYAEAAFGLSKQFTAAGRESWKASQEAIRAVRERRMPRLPKREAPKKKQEYVQSARIDKMVEDYYAYEDKKKAVPFKDKAKRQQMEKRLSAMWDAIQDARSEEMATMKSNPAALNKWVRFSDTRDGYVPDPNGNIYSYEATGLGTAEVFKMPKSAYNEAAWYIDVYYDRADVTDHSVREARPTLNEAKKRAIEMLVHPPNLFRRNVAQGNQMPQSILVRMNGRPLSKDEQRKFHGAFGGKRR